MDTITTVPEIIKRLGGNHAVAKMFGVVPSAVSNWSQRGFPDSISFYSQLMQECETLGFAADPALFERRKAS